MWFKKKATNEVSNGLNEVYPRLWRYCFALTKSRDLADDLAQSTCTRALEKASQFQTNTHLDRWLFKIANRTWLNDLRKSAVRRGNGLIDVEENDIASTNQDPEVNILSAEVLSAVMDLPIEQRKIVFLAYVEGYSYKECADMLDIPIGTVMSRLAAARKKISKQFKPEGMGNE